MYNFWTAKHDIQDKLYLSGNGQVTEIILQIEEYLAGAANILNVGVGLGVWEKYLHSVGKVVSSLDITPVAGETVGPYVSDFYLDPTQLPTGKFDLATELLVAQHIDNQTLYDHVSNIIRSLQPRGLYALQAPDFFESNKAEILANQSIESMKSGNVRRPVHFMDELIRSCGGRIVKVGYRGAFPQYNSVWYIYHIMHRGCV